MIPFRLLDQVRTVGGVERHHSQLQSRDANGRWRTCGILTLTRMEHVAFIARFYPPIEVLPDDPHATEDDFQTDPAEAATTH